MAKDTAVFVVDVDTGGVKEGSSSAAAELTKLSSAITKDKNELKELEQQMKLLQGSSKVDIATFKDLRAQIDAKKKSVQGSSEAYVAMGGKLGDIGKKSTAFAANASATAKSVANVGNQSGFAASMIGKLGPALANPYAALGAVAIAAATAGAAVFALGLAVADTARRNQIMLAAMTGSAEAGAKLGGKISELAKTLPLARDQIRSISDSLVDRGLKGAALESALSAIARTTSVLGSSAAGKLDAVVTKSKDLKRFTAQALDFTGSGIALDDVATALAKRTGVTMETARASIKAGAVDLATGLQALDDATAVKLGGAAKSLNTSLGAIGNRAKDNLAGLFSTINVEKFLGVVSDVVDLLSTSSETGKALADIVGRTFQPWLDLVGGNGATITGFFKDVVIAALEVEFMSLQAKNAVKAFAEDPIGSLSKLGERFKEVGTAIVDGVIQGIEANAGAAIGAVTGLAGSMISAVKNVNKQASPSKVYFDVGANNVKGMVGGIEREAPAAREAMAEVLPLPSAAGARAAGAAAVAGAGASAGAPPAMNVSVTIHVDGAAPDLEAQIVRVLESAYRQAYGAIPSVVVGPPTAGERAAA